MRRLVAMEAFAHAVRSVYAHARVAFSMSIPWLAILLVISIGRYFHMQANLTGDREKDAALAISTAIPSFLITIFAVCAIAVHWHRFVFKDEIATGFARLRADALVWRYYGNLVLITIILTFIVMMASLPLAIILALLQIPIDSLQNVGSWPLPLRLLVQFILTTLITSLFFRLAIKLPAVALDRQDFRLRDAWLASRGNMPNLLALAALNVLTVLSAELVLEGLGSVLIGAHETIGTLVMIVLGLLVQWFATILGTTILTSLYGFFVEERDF